MIDRAGLEPESETLALEVRSVTKTFAGTPALRDVSFGIRSGHIHCLVGGNGSGKSTLIKILAGVYHADAGGTVRAFNTEIAADHTTPAWARDAGFCFVHQDLAVFDDLTLAENLLVTTGFPTDPSGRIRWRQANESARRALREFGIDHKPNTPARKLGSAERAMLAIARAAQDGHRDGPRILVLDEPTATLPAHETEQFLQLLRQHAARGHTILLVTHRLDEVMAVADSITVFRDGSHVLTAPASTMNKQDLIGHILGKAIEQERRAAVGARPASTMLKVSGLMSGTLRGVELEVGAGEIVGVAGLRGAGRSRLLRCIFGAERTESGSIELDNAQLRGSVRDRMRQGVALVPENRDREATFNSLTLKENLLAGPADLWRWGRFHGGLERHALAAAKDQFRIKARSGSQVISSLSGGNRQKVILARWLRRDPKVLLLDEPSQGVDVGARADIHEFVRKAVAHGACAVVVSSDIEELALISDRVVVLAKGVIADELVGDQISAESITRRLFAETKESA